MTLFATYVRRYVRQNFHSLRIDRGGLPPEVGTRPLIAFVNHASWWDPLVCLLLTRAWWPERPAYAPMDASMLERYGLFKRLGFFGIEPGSPGGALTFLRTSMTILRTAPAVLWLTPQGRFADIRERPARLQGGIGTLAIRLPQAAFLPVAIEYTFWTEPRPEILVSCGPMIVPGDAQRCSSTAWARTLEDALEGTQNELARKVIERRTDHWLTLCQGKRGVSKGYDTWCRLRSRLKGMPFDPAHHPDAAP